MLGRGRLPTARRGRSPAIPGGVRTIGLAPCHHRLANLASSRQTHPARMNRATSDPWIGARGRVLHRRDPTRRLREVLTQHGRGGAGDGVGCCRDCGERCLSHRDMHQGQDARGARRRWLSLLDQRKCEIGPGEKRLQSGRSMRRRDLDRGGRSAGCRSTAPLHPTQPAAGRGGSAAIQPGAQPWSRARCSSFAVLHRNWM